MIQAIGKIKTLTYKQKAEFIRLIKVKQNRKGA